MTLTPISSCGLCSSAQWGRPASDALPSADYLFKEESLEH